MFVDNNIIKIMFINHLISNDFNTREINIQYVFQIVVSKNYAIIDYSCPKYDCKFELKNYYFYNCM